MSEESEVSGAEDKSDDLQKIAKRIVTEVSREFFEAVPAARKSDEAYLEAVSRGLSDLKFGRVTDRGDLARLLSDVLEREFQDLPDLRQSVETALVRFLEVWQSNLLESVVRANSQTSIRRSQMTTPRPVWPEAKRSASVCSDVHLGTAASRKDDFIAWMSKRKDEKVILLGDILDFWIYASDDDRNTLIDRVCAQWELLYEHVADMQDRNCEVHLVPGNHDGFILFAELQEGEDAWSDAVLARSPELRTLRKKTARKRLSDVADIHYPCYLFNEGGKRILATHGHYATWGWRLMVGLEETSTVVQPILGQVSIALAHKYARITRQMYNAASTLVHIANIEDTSLAITNALITAYEGAKGMLTGNPNDFVALLNRALALYFGHRQRIDAEEARRLRDSFLFLHKQRRRDVVKDLRLIRDRHAEFFRHSVHVSNIHIGRDKTGARALTREPLSSFAAFETMIFGHDHKPRESHNTFDSGGFVENIKTSLAIYTDGEVKRAD